MKHVKAFSIKLAVLLLWAWVLFQLIYSYPLSDVVIIGFLTNILLYILGDWFVLRKMGNRPTTLMDTVSALCVAWVYLLSTGSADPFLPSLFFALGVGFFELIFHEYLIKCGIINDERPRR
ncbi:MAG: DUF2512 family protein [Alkalibacterium sp.]|nr:DUF2512 family protein [Alkalibacterium sp.]